MRLIRCSFPVSKAIYGWYVKCQHTWARLAVHLKNMLDCCNLTDGRLLGITTDNASSNYSMTRELQSTHAASGIEWPALWNHIPCMEHVIQLALGALMSGLGVEGRTQSWEAHEGDQQFGQNAGLDIRKSQRLWISSNPRTNKVSAMKLGLAKIIEKVHISWYFESPEIELHIPKNACCIDYADTWSSKRVHWQSQYQSLHRGTSDYGCEDILELYTRVAGAHQQITGPHMWVASKSKIQWIPATLHNTRSMYHCEVCHGSVEVMPILDPVDVEEVYSYIPSRYHSVRWHVRSEAQCDVSFC